MIVSLTNLVSRGRGGSIGKWPPGWETTSGTSSMDAVTGAVGLRGEGSQGTLGKIALLGPGGTGMGASLAVGATVFDRAPKGRGSGGATGRSR